MWQPSRAVLLALSLTTFPVSLHAQGEAKKSESHPGKAEPTRKQVPPPPDLTAMPLMGRVYKGEVSEGVMITHNDLRIPQQPLPDPCDKKKADADPKAYEKCRGVLPHPPN
jgi:hypothetical protein